MAVVGASTALYLIVFYGELALRPGNPTHARCRRRSVGVLLLLEATRRAVGLPMAMLAVLFLGYVMAGPHLPDVIAHKGASIPRVVSHMWMVTEGVFGIALGVSVSFIFVFVLFGTLLDRAGGGNYMMQVSFALLGHLRGGPAKVAVVSSALNGLISGSSVSNVVSGGIFTIPLMKRAGYGGVKAAAIETSSSVNGQIMPPVMGAAAFLMVEYVGIPYSDIVKHAFIPAVISYIALFYIVHLEALKLGMEPTARERDRTMSNRLHVVGAGPGGQCGGARRDLLHRAGRAGGVRRGRAGDSRRAARRPVRLQHLGCRTPARSADRDRRQQSGAAAHLADGEGRPALPDPGGRADLVPDGRGTVARTVGVLGRDHADDADGDAAAADCAVPQAGRTGSPVHCRPERRAGRLQRRRSQHDRHRGGHRLRRHHRRRNHADRARPAHDRLRRVRLAGQRAGDAALHGVRLPGARHGRADDGQLHPGGDADGAGHRRTRRAVRAGDPADRGAPVRLLLRDHGRHHAAGGTGELRRCGHREGGPDPGRYPGFGLRGAHRRAAVHLDLQSGAAADRRAWLGRGTAGRRCIDDCVAALRRGDDGMVPHQVPLVGNRAAAGRDVHPVPARLVRGLDRPRVHRRAGVEVLRGGRRTRRQAIDWCS